jgi:uncharacterized protein (DUF1778 family)
MSIKITDEAYQKIRDMQQNPPPTPQALIDLWKERMRRMPAAVIEVSQEDFDRLLEAAKRAPNPSPELVELLSKGP